MLQQYNNSHLDLSYLQTELTRIDVLVRREVRRWNLAGQDPSDDYRGMYVSQAEVDALLNRPFATSWGQSIDLTPDEDKAFASAQTRIAEQSRSVAEEMQQNGYTPRLLQIAKDFGLNQLELDILLICLAPAFDPRYDRLYGYLQDNVNRRRPMIRLILDLLGPSGPERFSLASCFDSSAPLFKYELLELITESGTANPHWINQTLHPDDTIVAWLMGHYRPRRALEPHITLQSPQPTKTDQLLTNNVWPRLLRAGKEQPVMVFHGPDKTCQIAATHRLAAHLKRPILTIDLNPIIETGLSSFRALRLVLRDARLTGAVPFLTNWTTCVTSERAILPKILSTLCEHPDLIIVASEILWQAQDIERQRPILQVPFPKPNYEQRQSLWSHYVGAAITTESLDVDAVAGQFVLTTGQIRDAVASASDMAFERGDSLQTSDLFAAARRHSSLHLSDLARKITPRYSWGDIILPADQKTILHEMVATVRERPRVLEAWGVGQKLASSAGITSLFAGPPGTGKTMSAEVIAGELGLDLYKIDLSSVVSKYIGETEKNMERIFSEAESSNAILFFDEADALFGKRSEVRDAHDRYANIEISYLLQRMERYDGITILATNLGANMDEAFTRRLQFVVEFPMPSATDQQRIWETLLPAEVPRQPDLNFGLLTERFDLAGGNIRNILVNATYLAAADGGTVTMAHLLHGTRRELQKMGRLVDEADLNIEG